ncbi:MAG TPA: DUF3592 domain-containing protein [Acidimicrobiales bacterium]|jgi:hypothetical protein
MTPDGAGQGGVGSSTSRFWQEYQRNIASPRDACDGTDDHRLGMSRRGRFAILLVGIAVLVLTILIGQVVRFGAYGAGLCLGGVLAAGYSVALKGDSIVKYRFGVSTWVRLESVRRVEIYRYRGGVSLKLWKANGDKAPSVPVSSRFIHLEPAAAGHLLRYLDRPDVQWSAAAWSLLGGPSYVAPGTTGTVPMPADAAEHPEPAVDGTSDVDAAPEVTDRSRPRGTMINPTLNPKARRRARVFLSISLVSLGIGTIVLTVLAPVTWSHYLTSERIQHGPEASASIENISTSEDSTNSGTNYTTYFLVSFETANGGANIVTMVTAPGTYPHEAVGDDIAVRYDPSHPKDAELAGHPATTIDSALITTGIAAFLWCAVGQAAYRYLKFRRRRRLAAAPNPASTPVPG